MTNAAEAPTVSLLGAPGAYHDIACDYLAPEAGEDERIRCGDFNEIFERLATGEAAKAIMAVANSEIGALRDAYDVIARNDAYATGEIRLRIRHNLLVPPSVESLDEIEVVHSNPKALQQCKGWLGRHLPDAERQSGADTASCAQAIAEQGDRTQAAIASRQAAEIYGLKTIGGSIEDNPDNETRFLLFERQPREIAGADKTSIILATPNHASALYDALGVWATRDIGLSMVESRLVPHQVRDPWGALLHARGQHDQLDRLREDDPTTPWDAYFYIDIEAGTQEPRMREAMAELESQDGVKIRPLGSYRAGELVE